jgi:preprotein translocase subunit YajC
MQNLKIGQKVITMRGGGIVTEIRAEDIIRVRLTSGEIYSFNRERVSNLQALSAFLKVRL